MDCGYFSGRYRQQLKCHVSLLGPMPSEVNLGVRRFISAFQSRVRTSPLASELPLTCEALPFAGGASAPYLPGYARQLLIVRCAHYAGGASLSTFGFVTIVPRYLLVQVMPSHSFAALTALIVRRVNGFADRPMPACTGRPHAPRRGIGVRTRQRHLAAVRGACRACCAPRKRDCGLSCAPCKW